MKILVIHNRYREAGGEDRVYEQEVALLRSCGHEVRTFERSNAEIDAAGLAAKAALPRRLRRAEDSCAALQAELDRHPPEIAHVHNTHFMLSPAIFPLLRARGVGVVHTLHNFRPLCAAATLYRRGEVCEECLGRKLWRGVLHGCYRGSRLQTAALASATHAHRRARTLEDNVHRFICLTHFAAQRYVAAGLPNDRIRVKPNFVLEEPAQRRGKGEELLFLGRLTPEKGIESLLAALRETRDVPFRIVGDGPLAGRVRDTIASEELDHVVLEAWKTPEAVRAALARARAVVVPSEWYEGFGLVVIEAYAAGVPVIASDIGSLAEIVEGGETGLLVPPRDPAALAKAISRAWQHPGESADMGRKARAVYEARYSPERNYERLLAIYEEALAAARAG